MKMKMTLAKGIHQQSLQAHLATIFTSQSIPTRINTFNQCSSLPSSPSIQIEMPSYLQECSGKALMDFIKENGIAENVRIVHALAHIEFNAFTAYAHTLFHFHEKVSAESRAEFAEEMRRISSDEGRHCLMLMERLKGLGYNYGDLPVISSLTKIIQETEHDLLSRIGLISLVHEGQGRKAVKRLINKLENLKDMESVGILKTIEQEEELHYKLGVKWFRHECLARGLSVDEAVQSLNHKFKCRLSV